MAGDWIKMECATPDKQEVMAIAARLGWDDPDFVVGKLFRLWRWFDQQTVEGNATGVTKALLDRMIGVTGFCDAVESVGWLEVHEGGVSLPNFRRHCGKTAKDRAMTAKRVADFKGKKAEEAGPNGTSNASSVTSSLPREEKRRSNPHTPVPGGFERFWEAYPRKASKGAAEKAWRSIKPNEETLGLILQAIDAARASEQWQEAGGKYVPHPATWLRATGWLDERKGVTSNAAWAGAK